MTSARRTIEWFRTVVPHSRPEADLVLSMEQAGTLLAAWDERERALRELGACGTCRGTGLIRSWAEVGVPHFECPDCDGGLHPRAREVLWEDAT